MLTGFYIGAICLCLSPFNLYRFLQTNDYETSTSIVKATLSSILALNNIYITFILLAGVIWCTSGRYKSVLSDFLNRYIIFIISLIVSALFVIITHHTSDNSRFPTELYATVLLICLLNYIDVNKIRFLSVICFLVTTIGMYFVIPKAIGNYKSYEEMKSQIENGNSLIVSDDIDTNFYLKRYIHSISSIYESYSLDAIKSYYGGKSDSSILSAEMYGLMQKYNVSGTRIYKPSWGMSCVRVPDRGEIDNVIYTLKPVDISSMPFWKRLIAPLFGRYTLNEVPAHRYHILYINNERWLIVLDHPMVNDRVNGMRICIKD